jgi:hypothetical protein
LTGTAIRRRLLVALAAALCVAAATGIAAILTGDFGHDEGSVLLTSLAFAVFSATTAPGASLRLRQSPSLRALGAATVGFSVASFVLFAFAVWTEDDETLWRSFGCAGLAAFACTHAALVSGARRSTDSPLVVTLCTVSIVLGAADAGFGIAAASGAVDHVDRGLVELIAVLVVLLVLTTALPPIIRRIVSSPVVRERPSSRPAPFAAGVLEAADRIDALNGDPGNRAPEIRREVERLRELVRTHWG